MSTHTITVSGPSARLATLRALALKAVGHARDLWHRLRLTLTSSGRMLTTTATSVLALIGSDTGYDLAVHAVGTAMDVVGSLLGSAVRVVGLAARWVGRALLGPVRVVSPVAADTCQQLATTWVAEPVHRVITTAQTWIGQARLVIADLTGTTLVRTATVWAAQVASVILGLHALTQGALAARIVTALPWTMTGVVWATQPVTAAIAVAGTFLAALAYAAVRIWTQRPDSDTDPTPDHTVTIDEAPRLLAGPRPQPRTQLDLDAVAATLYVEVATDGSVLVHGIPHELPEDTALEVAHIAADAATNRLRKILLHRPQPNRDDLRLLTKTAREAVRLEGRRRARAS